MLLAAFFWFTSFHIYEPASAPASLIMLLLALLLASASFWRAKGYGLQWKLLRSCLLDGGAQLFLVLAAQALVFPFFYWFFVRNHAESVFSIISGNLLNLIGLRTVVEGDAIYISASLRTVLIASTWEKAAAFHFAMMLVGGCALLAAKRASAARYLALLISSCIFAVLRYAFLLAVYSHYMLHSVFWERTITFLSLLPFAFILAMLMGKLPERGTGISPAKLLRDSFAFKKDGRGLPTVLAALAAASLLVSGTAFWGLRDPGAEKRGRVVVDEYHSDWEWTDEAYDENWFGERSGYNYYCFYEHIDRYYSTSRNFEPITPEVLANTDILVLKTPTNPYSDEEVTAILDYVYNGGGLYLIGDHTNVFGTSAFLNQISVPFGIRFRYDCTYELTRGSLQEYNTPRLLPHPAVRGLPHFLFATSCTLKTDWRADEIIVGYGLRNLPLDYSQKNFFPADPNSPLMEFGAFVQSAGIAHGKGRVLAFTDSTVFSNFWMFMPGKPELLLNSLQWLNRENVFPVPPRPVAAVCVALSIAALGFSAWRHAKRNRLFPIGPCICAAIAAFGVSAALLSAHASSAQMPEANKPVTLVCFESSYTSGYLPKDLHGFHASSTETISTFYVWAQRLRLVPSLEHGPVEALEKGDLAVIMKPSRQILETDDIIRHVESGKTLLLVDNIDSGNNAAQLLEHAGLRIYNADKPDTAFVSPLLSVEFTEIPLTQRAAFIEGGQPLITDADGNSVFSVQTVGNGMIAVFSDPDLLYNSRLGDVSANLTDQTRLLTKLVFEMYRYLLDIET